MIFNIIYFINRVSFAYKDMKNFFELSRLWSIRKGYKYEIFAQDAYRFWPCRIKFWSKNLDRFRNYRVSLKASLMTFFHTFSRTTQQLLMFSKFDCCAWENVTLSHGLSESLQVLLDKYMLHGIKETFLVISTDFHMNFSENRYGAGFLWLIQADHPRMLLLMWKMKTEHGYTSAFSL